MQRNSKSLTYHHHASQLKEGLCAEMPLFFTEKKTVTVVKHLKSRGKKDQPTSVFLNVESKPRTDFFLRKPLNAWDPKPSKHKAKDLTFADDLSILCFWLSQPAVTHFGPKPGAELQGELLPTLHKACPPPFPAFTHQEPTYRQPCDPVRVQTDLENKWMNNL